MLVPPNNNWLSSTDWPDAVLSVRGRHRATTDLDQETLALLFLPCLFGLFLMWFEDAQPAALGLGVQSGHGSAQAQGLAFIEAEALSKNGSPQGQDGGTVDEDGFPDHVILLPGRSGHQGPHRSGVRQGRWSSRQWPTSELSAG